MQSERARERKGGSKRKTSIVLAAGIDDSAKQNWLVKCRKCRECSLSL